MCMGRSICTGGVAESCTQEERESTFRPKINKASQHMPRGRPLHEMGQVEYAARTARREAARQKAEDAEVHWASGGGLLLGGCCMVGCNKLM